MGTVNSERKKIVLDTVHASSVSKAVWPIHTRMNTDNIDHKRRQLKRRRKLPHAAFAISPPSQGNTHKPMSMPRWGTSSNPINHCRAGLASALRIAFSLGIAGLALVLSTFYSWTILLILSLICATITLIMMHLLVNTEHTHQPSALPASAATSPTLEKTQTSQYQQPDSTTLFPTTPMPATPVIRVLDTIDLSSTNIEHFLDT